MPRLLILFLILSLPALPGAWAANTAKPAPAPVVKKKKKEPRKGPGITGRLVKPEPIKIGPKGKQGPSTGFVLSRIPNKPGNLSLGFVSTDKSLKLNSKTGLVAQIYSDEEIEVEPSILTAANWPKNSDKILLKYKVQNAKKGQEYEVEGEVAYTVCHVKTNVCESRKSSLYLTITP